MYLLDMIASGLTTYLLSDSSSIYTCTCDAADGEDQAKARNSYQAAPVVLLGPPRLFGRHDGNGVPNDDDDADGDGVCWAINLVSK